MSLIIFLNGCGSSGKTSIAHSIQNLSDNPWIHISMDAFIDMLPADFVGFGKKSPSGYFSFSQRKNEHGEKIEVKTTELGKKFFNSIPIFAKTIADQGSNLIIDEVLLDTDSLKEYFRYLNSHTVYFIGVFCDLKTMQEREKLRNDRCIGLSNGQIDTVHTGIQYDLKVDTTNRPSESIAKEILTFIGKHPK